MFAGVMRSRLELNKFTAADGDVVHNGAPVDLRLLNNEKWEALALLPVHPGVKGKGCGSKRTSIISSRFLIMTLLPTTAGLCSSGVEKNYADDFRVHELWTVPVC